MIWLFYAANLFTVVIWGLLIVAPRATVTRRVALALWPFLILTIYYVLNLFVTVTRQPVGMMSLEAFFAVPTGLYAGWTHYLVVDLFAGRYIYHNTRHFNGWYILNQLLTLCFAPLGVLLFLIRQRSFAERI